MDYWVIKILTEVNTSIIANNGFDYESCTKVTSTWTEEWLIVSKCLGKNGWG